MERLPSWIEQEEYGLITNTEKAYLEAAFAHRNNLLRLSDLWNLMDQAWDLLDCNASVEDHRIEAFYSHPVWLLNGLFSERDPESRHFRSMVTDWVGKQHFSRIADYGGGFGALARMIGKKYPSTFVEIIEPYPHAIAKYRAKDVSNVSYRAELSGQYDIILSTDVLEHVQDPLLLISQTAPSLKEGGIYFMANCFKPVIRCHLPQLYHFNFSWKAIMSAMGLEHLGRIGYGDAFRFAGTIYLERARMAEVRSKYLWKKLSFLPGRVGRPLANLLIKSSPRRRASFF